MKYIRTEDEIIKIEYEWEYASCGGITVYNENENLYITDDDIIKTANTIEELCDEFVALGYGLKGKPAVVIGNNGFKTIKEMLSNYTIYGAIWTDKGLIYVAKMNENGELELL